MNLSTVYNSMMKSAAEKAKAEEIDLGDGWTYECSTPEDYTAANRIKANSRVMNFGDIKVAQQAMMRKQADWTPEWMKSTGKWLNRNVVTPVVETAQGIAHDPWQFVKDYEASKWSTMAHVGTGLRDIPNAARTIYGHVGKAIADRYDWNPAVKEHFDRQRDAGTRDSHNLWAENAIAQKDWAELNGWNTDNISNSVKIYGDYGTGDLAADTTSLALGAAAGSGALKPISTGIKAIPHIGKGLDAAAKTYLGVNGLLNLSETVPSTVNFANEYLLGGKSIKGAQRARDYVRSFADKTGLRTAFPIYDAQRDIQEVNPATGRSYITDSAMDTGLQIATRPYAFRANRLNNLGPDAQNQIGYAVKDTLSAVPYYDKVRNSSPYKKFNLVPQT